jgi:hypothetical protein
MALDYKTATAFLSNINYLVNNVTKIVNRTGKISDGVPKIFTSVSAV